MLFYVAMEGPEPEVVGAEAGVLLAPAGDGGPPPPVGDGHPPPPVGDGRPPPPVGDGRPPPPCSR